MPLLEGKLNYFSFHFLGSPSILFAFCVCVSDENSELNSVCVTFWRVPGESDRWLDWRAGKKV